MAETTMTRKQMLTEIQMLRSKVAQQDYELACNKEAISEQQALITELQMQVAALEDLRASLS